MPVVLAATDLSALSARVPLRAAQAARALGVPVVLVHVVASGSPPLEVSRLRSRLEHALAESGAPADSAVVLATGAPEEAIVSLATSLEAALVVMGLHRLRPTLDLLRLTTMERIVLALDAPALIAHAGQDGAYRSVLVATDFCPASAAAAGLARRLAPQARFRAVHALSLSLIERRPGVDPDSTASMAAAEAASKAWMAAGMGDVLPQPAEILPGAVHDVLGFALEDAPTDLLAIGSGSERHRGKLGHYARDLMRAPPTDMLVAHAPRGVQGAGDAPTVRDGGEGGDGADGGGD
jgi:nucleotide-binding universal stress UspA family protein